MTRYLGSTPAHPFPSDVEWLNVESPVTLEELRGRLLLLHFWSYTNVHTHHALEHLSALRKQHGGRLEALAVHSSLFEAERRSANVKHAVRRMHLEVPVVNDVRDTLAAAYGVASRPTLLFVDPLGNTITRHIGALDADGLGSITEKMLQEFDRGGHLAEHASPLRLSAVRVPATGERALGYPTGVAYADGKLYVSDSGNGRVVCFEREGNASFEVSSAGGAPFKSPSGLAVSASHVYVADAGRHQVMRINKERASDAEVVAGNGRNGLVRHPGGPALKLPLSSPVALSAIGGHIYVAVAGFHQIWKLDADAGTMEPWVGDGKAGIVDDVRYKARLCQPCAIAGGTDKGQFFVDNQTNAVRAVNMAEEGRVVTFVGQSMLDYGDYDAVGKKARLLHPGGIARIGDSVWVADTHNNKIKVINLNSLQMTTVAGDGTPGYRDGEGRNAQLNYPTALTTDGQRLYIADTNNGLVRRLDPETSQLTTFAISE